MTENRGYDWANEQLDKLAAESMDYTPVCGAGPGAEPPNPKGIIPVENQRSWPSCGGHALSSLHEWILYLATGSYTQLSRMFAWVESQRVNGTPSVSRGVSIYAAVKVAKEIGLPREELAPYTYGDFYSKFSGDAYKDAGTRLVLHSYNLKTVEQVEDFSKSGMGGIIWGVPWKFNMRAWHAVCTFRFGEGLNSWGPDWDGDGWFDWSREEISKYLRQSGTVAIGLSDLDKPQVREDRPWLERGLV